MGTTEPRRHGDTETQRHGDTELYEEYCRLILKTYLCNSVSPCLCVAVSPWFKKIKWLPATQRILYYIHPTTSFEDQQKRVHIQETSF